MSKYAYSKCRQQRIKTVFNNLILLICFYICKFLFQITKQNKNVGVILKRFYMFSFGAQTLQLLRNESPKNCERLIVTDLEYFPSISKSDNSYEFPVSNLQRALSAPKSSNLKKKKKKIKQLFRINWQHFTNLRSNRAAICRLLRADKVNRYDVKVNNTFLSCSLEIG